MNSHNSQKYLLLGPPELLGPMREMFVQEKIEHDHLTVSDTLVHNLQGIAKKLEESLPAKIIIALSPSCYRVMPRKYKRPGLLRACSESFILLLGYLVGYVESANVLCIQSKPWTYPLIPKDCPNCLIRILLPTLKPHCSNNSENNS